MLKNGAMPVPKLIIVRFKFELACMLIVNYSSTFRLALLTLPKKLKAKS